MKDYMIVTDSNADLPQSYVAEQQIVVIPMAYNLDDKIYGEDENLDVKVFYNKMREGAKPTTMALNPHAYEVAFRKVLESGKGLIYFCFSSGFSGCYSSALMAKQTLEEENPDWKINIIDTLSGSMGQGLLIYKAQQQKLSGKSIDEVTAWAEIHKLSICHQFTVDDLMHLHRGGRISKATAIVGSLIHVKPVLHVDQNGHMLARCNVRGRKKALGALVDHMEKTVGHFHAENKEMICISHADCEEDALYLKKKIQEKLGYEHFMVNMISPIIGAHAGPGAIGVFYMGEER